MVRDPSRDHLYSMAKIFVEAFSGAPWYETWEIQSAIAYLHSQIADGEIAIVEVESQIAGFSIGLPLIKHKDSKDMISNGAKSWDYYISEVAVSIRFQGKGVAKQLVRGITGHGLSIHPNVTLRTRADHDHMIHLMTSLQFKKIAVYEAESGGVRSDRVLLRR